MTDTQFGAEKLKADLMQVRVPGYSNGLVWNVRSKSYMNAERNSEPSAGEMAREMAEKTFREAESELKHVEALQEMLKEGPGTPKDAEW